MKTNCKEIKAKIREHINEFYTPAELKDQVESIMQNKRNFPTVYHAVKHMAEGGCFLVYNSDIVEFLNALGINPNNKEYPVHESFNLYCHLLARDAGLIVKYA